MMTYTQATQILLDQKIKITRGVPGDWRKLYQVALTQNRRIRRLEADIALLEELKRASMPD